MAASHQKAAPSALKAFSDPVSCRLKAVCTAPSFAMNRPVRLVPARRGDCGAGEVAGGAASAAAVAVGAPCCGTAGAGVGAGASAGAGATSAAEGGPAAGAIG